MLFKNSLEEKLYKMICSYYDNKGISYQRVDKDHLVLVVNREREIPVNLFVAAKAKPLTLQICGRLPFKVPEDSREMMIMALQAINQRLDVGRFQMDTSDGTVDYRASLPLVGIQYDEEWLDNVLNDALYTITHRDEKIYSLLQGKLTFEEFDKYVR